MLGGSPWRTQQRCCRSSFIVQLLALPSMFHSLLFGNMHMSGGPDALSQSHPKLPLSILYHHAYHRAPAGASCSVVMGPPSDREYKRWTNICPPFGSVVISSMSAPHLQWVGQVGSPFGGRRVSTKSCQSFSRPSPSTCGKSKSPMRFMLPW